MNDYIAVMDIGTTGVRMLVAKVGDNGKPHIVARDCAVCRGIRNFKLDNPEEVTEAIKKVLKKVRDKTEIVVNSAYVSIPGSGIKYVRNVETVNINAVYNENGEFGPGSEPGIIVGDDVAHLLDRVERTDLFDNEYLLGAVPNRFIVDGSIQTMSPVGLRAGTLKVDAQLLIAENTFVESISACVKAAGLEIDGFIPLAVAVKSLLSACKNPDASTLFIDVGGSITEFAVYYRGAIYYASAIPVGGETITADIAQVLNVRREEADLLKTEYQIADSSLVENDVDVAVSTVSDSRTKVVKCSEIVGIMQARIEDIFGIIKERLSIEEIDTEFIDRVVLSGDGIMGFAGLEKVCGRIFGSPLSDVDFTRNTAMKAIFTYASGMIMYVTSMLPYGMRRSSITREQHEEAPAENKESIFSGLKGKLRDIVSKFRD